jgi:hypothetical protein
MSYRINTTKFYVFVAIGLLIFSFFAVLSYGAREKLNSEDLTPEETSNQRLIYAVSKIGSMIGFVIALIPSVRILQAGFINR